jgi:hypothetical protein
MRRRRDPHNPARDDRTRKKSKRPPRPAGEIQQPLVEPSNLSDVPAAGPIPEDRRAAVPWLAVGLTAIAGNLAWLLSASKVGFPETGRLYLAGGGISLLVAIGALIAGLFLLGGGRISGFIRGLLQGAASRLGVGAGRVPLLAGGLAFAFLAAAAAGDRIRMFNPAVALLCWAAAIVLAVAGFWSRPAPGANPRPAVEWMWLFFLFALLVRLLAIGLPPFSGDEGFTGMDAMMFIRGDADSFFRPVGVHSFPGLYFFLVALSVRLFGHTVLALRFPSIIAGALTAGLVYGVGRAMFGHRAGVVAATVLAVSPYHFVFSHLGINNVWDALGYTAFAGAAWYAWKTGRRNAFILAGLSLGLAQYFYASARLLWLLAAGWMAAAFLIDRDRFKRNGGSWIALWTSAMAAFLPILFYLAAQPAEYFAHTVSRSIFQSDLFRNAGGSSVWGLVWNQLYRGFGAFAFVPSMSWYSSRAPLLRPLEAALFLAGLVLLALKPRNLRSVLLLGWVVIFGLIGALSVDAPSSQRTIGAAPACALVIAFALTEICSRFGAWIPALKKAAAAAALAAVAFLAADNLHFTFAEFLPDSRFLGKYEFEGAGIVVQNRVAELLRERPAGYEAVYMVGGIVVAPTFPSHLFLLPEDAAVVFDRPYGSAENPELELSRLFFIIPAEREQELGQIMQDYPGGTVAVVYNWDRTPLFTYYDVVLEENELVGTSIARPVFYSA